MKNMIVKEMYYKVKKIKISNTCEPYMYSTYDDLNQVEIGDILTLKFGNKSYGVKKEYVGKTIKFVVSNYKEHKWARKTRRLALIPFTKRYDYDKSNVNNKDVLFLDDSDRFDCLMMDLFPVNRRPYAGWKNKIVKIENIDTRTKKINNFFYLKNIITFVEIKILKDG